MECPNCKYKDGWNDETLETEEGEEGSFFRMTNSIKMENTDDSIRHICGCPKCNQLFMD